MSRNRPPTSLAAERAVRYLRLHRGPASSTTLAEAVLATRVRDEPNARRILETAFAGDPRLVFDGGGWRRTDGASESRTAATDAAAAPDPARVLLVATGRRPSRGAPFELRSIAAIRIEEGEVSSACGGDVVRAAAGDDLREAVREALVGAVPVLHDPPGAIDAIERWLDEPLPPLLSVRRLGALRLGLPAAHGLDALAGALGLSWRETDDPLDVADVLEAALDALRRPGEDLDALRAASLGGAPPLDWSRFAFDRSFLRDLPHVPGTYRFLDARGRLLYVGKSRNLHARICSYFHEGSRRTSRVRALLDALHRIEVEPLGSDLEAVLQEAAQIRRREPSRNVQRKLHPRGGHEGRLRSILILEPAAPPHALRAYLLRDGRLLDRVAIGPRGGGLRRIERLLETRFFSFEPGPTSVPGPDVDVELVARWLAANRDRAVAFDPTHLRSAREVIARLRLFLERGALFEPDGTPTIVR